MEIYADRRPRSIPRRRPWAADLPAINDAHCGAWLLLLVALLESCESRSGRPARRLGARLARAESSWRAAMGPGPLARAIEALPPLTGELRRAALGLDAVVTA